MCIRDRLFCAPGILQCNKSFPGGSMAKKILVATDGSDQAKDAIVLGIQFAESQGLELVALRVVDVDRYASEFETVRDVVMKQLEEQAQRILGDAKAQVEAAGLSLDTLVRHGDSSRE